MRKYLPETLFLVSFIVINIFPLGCFSSTPNTVPVVQPYPTAPSGIINGNDYLNALQCVVSNQSTPQTLKNSAKSKIIDIQNQIKQSGSSMISVDPSEINYYYTNAPACPFNSFSNY